MITVKSVEVENLENAGCNNGNYPKMIVYFYSGSKYIGQTCNCGKGCNGNDRCPSINMRFNNMEDFINYIAS